MVSPEIIGGPIKPIIFVSTDSTSQGVRLIDNCQYVVSKDYYVGVAEGDISDHISFTKFGLNEDIDIDEEDLWYVGGTYVFPTSGMQMEVYCSSTKDINGGTGANSMMLTYLTSDFVQHTTQITLTSTDPILTGATDIYRVNSWRIVSAGTISKADGYVDIRNTADTPIYSRVPSSGTRARNACYTVPDGYNFYIAQNTYSIGNAGNAKVFGRFSMKSNYNEATSTIGSIFFPLSEIGVTDNSWSAQYAVPPKIISHSDLRVTCRGDALTANAVATIQYRGWLDPTT
jgi:hypothetical protein